MTRSIGAARQPGFLGLSAPLPLPPPGPAPVSARRRRLTELAVVSAALHGVILAAFLVAPRPPVPPPEVPPAEVALEFEGGRPTATAPVPTPETDVSTVGPPLALNEPSAPPAGVTSPEPATPSPPPAAAPEPANEPARIEQTPPLPPVPPVPTTQAQAPRPTPPASAPQPNVATLAPPPPDLEALPVPPIPPTTAPEPQPAAPPTPPQIAARPPPPPPQPSVARPTPPRPAPPRIAARPAPLAPSAFPRPTFAFNGSPLDGASHGVAAPHLAFGPAQQGPRSAAPSLDISGDLGEDYRQLLRAWLERHKYYPEQAIENGEDGTASVHVIAERDGRVRLVELAGRSGSTWLDMGAQALFRGQRLPPFPAGSTRDEYEFDVVIHYILVRR